MDILSGHGFSQKFVHTVSKDFSVFYWKFAILQLLRQSHEVNDII